MKKHAPVILPIAAALLLALVYLRWHFITHGNAYDVHYTPTAADSIASAPSLLLLPGNDSGRQIRYGRELIVNTAQYLGPEGTLAHLGNGMNCQNCHLDAGTRPWGNNYLAVAATYPKFRERSGGVESIEKRVADCFHRSSRMKRPGTLPHSSTASPGRG